VLLSFQSVSIVQSLTHIPSYLFSLVFFWVFHKKFSRSSQCHCLHFFLFILIANLSSIPHVYYTFEFFSSPPHFFSSYQSKRFCRCCLSVSFNFFLFVLLFSSPVANVFSSCSHSQFPPPLILIDVLALFLNVSTPCYSLSRTSWPAEPTTLLSFSFLFSFHIFFSFLCELIMFHLKVCQSHIGHACKEQLCQLPLIVLVEPVGLFHDDLESKLFFIYFFFPVFFLHVSCFFFFPFCRVMNSLRFRLECASVVSFEIAQFSVFVLSLPPCLVTALSK
jgi:hypothetical protein